MTVQKLIAIDFLTVFIQAINQDIIRVLDEELAEALKQLPEQSRNIVLMFFFLDMSDSEIGEKLNINRSTSYRHRRNSLEEIRKQLKEKKTNEE